MPHVFKKYTSNRGSALFMVISTMTALIISCMAMYFSMLSSRSSQYAVFNQMQANQSAQSIANIVSNSISNAANLSDPDPAGQALLEKIKGLTDIGDTISTTADQFESLDPNNASAHGKKDVDQLGAYAITITLTKIDPDGTKWYDIAVISSVSGNKDVVHMEYGFNENETTTGGGNNPPGDSELFAATGYVPNDAYLDGGFFLTNTFFDTEFTYVGMYDSKANFLSGNLSTGGSLIFSSYIQPISRESGLSFLARPTVWSIRGDFEENGSNKVALMPGSKMMIGGDAHFNVSSAAVEGGSGTLAIYVLGDFYMETNQGFDGVDLYVQGDVHLGSGIGGAWGSFSNIYVNGTINGSESTNKWDWSADDPRGMSIPEVEEELGRRTSTQTYGKWVIPDSNVNESEPIKIELNSSNKPADGVKAFKCVYTIAYDENTESAKAGTADAIGSGFTIDGFKGDCKTYAGVPLAIVLDTGDDPDNIMSLRLKPYLDNNGNIVSDPTKATTFAWLPNISGNNTPFTILVKGRGSVILDVAEGATYQEVNFQQFMHYSWFKLLGGTEENRTGLSCVVSQTPTDWGVQDNWGTTSTYSYSSGNISGGQSFFGKSPNAIAASFIHDDCIKGDGCSYSYPESDLTCGACGGKLIDIVCTDHGKVDSYCPSCQKYKQDKVDRWGAASGGSARVEGFCANHIDTPVIDEFLNDHSDIKDDISDDNGVIYPNANIYLVSISESAELRFSNDVKGNSIMQNGFYGYIYAPYITYKAQGNSGLPSPRFLGGMVVSDYVINDTYAFLACYPDRMPEELTSMPGGGNMTGNLAGKTTKSWKVTIGGYH